MLFRTALKPDARSLVGLYYQEDKKDKHHQYAKSPLDIPAKARRKLLLTSILLTLTIGWVVVGGLWGVSYMSADNLKVKVSNKNSSDVEAKDIIAKLLPHLADSYDNDKELDSALVAAFKEGISIQAINSVCGNALTINQLVGTPGVGFQYNRKPASVVAESLGLSADSDLKSFSKEDWRHYVVVSSILILRDELTKELYYPLRMIQALHGPIQWITFFAAVYCLVLLTTRNRWIKLQSSLIAWLDNPEDYERLNWNVELSNNILEDYYHGEGIEYSKLSKDYPGVFLVEKFIHDTAHLEQGCHTPDAVRQFINSKINAYRDAVGASEYLLINFLLWAAPTFGFIGTIFGIIGAMEGASGIFQAAGAIEQSVALDKVAGSLGTAFDTTFVSLVWMVPLMFLSSSVQKREEEVFSKLEHIAIENLPKKLKVKVESNG